jgi:hypothetical protein
MWFTSSSEKVELFIFFVFAFLIHQTRHVCWEGEKKLNWIIRNDKKCFLGKKISKIFND